MFRGMYQSVTDENKEKLNIINGSKADMKENVVPAKKWLVELHIKIMEET